jgi:hypothetical protein
MNDLPFSGVVGANGPGCQMIQNRRHRVTSTMWRRGIGWRRPEETIGGRKQAREDDHERQRT